MSARFTMSTTCHDLYAAVARHFGSHPSQSLVVLAVEEAQPAAAFRFELPTAATKQRWAADLGDLLEHHNATNLAFVAYGNAGRTNVALQAAIEVADAHSAQIVNVLRVFDDSYVAASCILNGACPFDGHPRPAGDTPPGPDTITTRAPADVLAAFAADPTDSASWLRDAFDAELGRLAALLANEPETAIGQIHHDGLKLLDQHATSVDLSPEDLSRVLLALTHRRIRDHAIMLTDRHGPRSTISTWAHLTRCAPEGFVAPAATLLAFAAWRLGDDVLAQEAVNRAAADDPGYTLARQLGDLLAAKIPASQLEAINAQWLADAWDDAPF